MVLFIAASTIASRPVFAGTGSYRKSFSISFLIIAVMFGGMTTTVKALPAMIQSRGLVCVPAAWSDVVSFFLVNYVAHAASIKPRAGEGTSSVMLTTFTALLFPFSGAMRGFVALTMRPRYKGDALQQAARAGALCVVSRTKDWRPIAGQEVTGCIFLCPKLESDRVQVRVVVDQDALIYIVGPPRRRNGWSGLRGL